MQRLCKTAVGGIFLVISVSTVLGAQPVSGSRSSEQARLHVIEPTQGRPVMVRPDENFYFMYSATDPQIQRIEVFLVNCLSERERVPLTATGRPYQIQKTYQTMLLKVPDQTRPGVYDLLINLGEYYQRVPRAVKVLAPEKEKEKDSFRFIHLSNMNIGDPTAPDFDARLVDEINLLNPAFVIATGDYIEDSTDRSENWRRIGAFFARLDVPSYLLCGDLEDPSVFRRQVDARAVTSFDYGSYHFILMLDTQRHPINEHRSNIEAVLADLTEASAESMSIFIGRSEDLGILSGLRAADGNPAEVFKKHRVKLMICGGSTDWDYREHGRELNSANLESVQYVRTGQSSTSTKNGGSGTSRYRVFEVRGPEIRYIYREESSVPRQHSIPVGGLRRFNYGPNDASRSTERISLVNTLNQSFADCRVIFRLKGDDPKSVWVFNCQQQQVLKGESPGQLIVVAKVNLPEKSGVQVLATTDPSQRQKYRKLPVSFSLAPVERITFSRHRSENGLAYLAAGKRLELKVKNLSDKKVSVRLQVRLAGQALMIQRLQMPGQMPPPGLTSETVDLNGGETATIAISPVVRSITAGEHYLSVYCLNDPLGRVWIEKVQVALKSTSK